MVAESFSRNLPFAKAYNFRDVGGYTGLDGRTVRWRRLFRADSLHRLSEQDTEAFALLGIKTVIDLRRPFEIEKFGRVAEEHGVDYRNVVLRHVDWEGVEHPEDVLHERWLADRYLNFAEDGHEGIAEALRVIASADAAPVVVHCMAGKDRTGTVCALALSLVGVGDEEIAADYALTTEAMRPLTDYLLRSSPESVLGNEHMFDSPPEAMMMFLEDLRALHGSVENFAKQIGLTDNDLTALRQNLLEP
ncbi:protein tyrosine/serine phosphatase [Actinoplanes lutulentus]|uniref:Protein tyrosine/serine phosphatase n=1 Tax=Actinoplanes lutulentus TaxID=1287878 RepID=A0A327Z3Q3_9ACTN|nr:tyrosine-protein phosphatase [Actinoplanes lutulentus]MBB2942127.1 protein tyrosine/serine phosphatase [Actinoplanes lutulentus]RAK26919.1 protein tyrosine/serine phosphatase [Actinoplanes lutulentus]